MNTVTRMHMCAVHVCLVPLEVRRGVEFPGTGVRDGWELPCGFWESNQVLWKNRRLNYWAISPALEVPLNTHDPDSIYTSLSGLAAQMSAWMCLRGTSSLHLWLLLSNLLQGTKTFPPSCTSQRLRRYCPVSRQGLSLSSAHRWSLYLCHRIV